MSGVVKNCSNPGCNKVESEEVKLRACSQCHTVSYCSVDCQRQHWRAGHKLSCGSTISNEPRAQKKKPTIKTTDYATNKKDMEKEWDAHNKEYRKLLKETSDGNPLGKNIVNISHTAFGMVAPGQPLPEGVPKNFHLKQRAQACFFSGRRNDIAQGKIGIFKHERVYLEYHEDLLQNEQDWVSFFSHPENYVHAEQTCGILGTLATIFRQRGDTESYKKCEEVLDMEKKVLGLYKVSVDALDESERGSSIHCYNELEYKYCLIRFNLYMYTKQLDKASPYLRKCLEYEAKENISDDDQNVLFFLMMLGLQPTLRNVKNLSELQLRKLIRKLHDFSKSQMDSEGEKASRERVALVKCEGCGKTEKAIDDFKACSRCLKVYYCSRACQKKHYKVHKKVCNKKE